MQLERTQKKTIFLSCSLLLGAVLVPVLILVLGTWYGRQMFTDTIAESTETQTTTAAAAMPTASPIQATTEYIEPPESIQLEVPYISQAGLLPTGCELVSAKMVLEYYGAEVTVNDIVDNTFCKYPQTIGGKTYGYHPKAAFIGNPWDESSFGCFPPVVVEMMNKLLPEGKQAEDVSKTELRTLAETYLPRNMPVLVWATIHMMESYPTVGWYVLDENGDPTDEWYEWQANEHCMVLVGYDSDCYYFNDPYGSRGLVAYERALAEQRYAEIGSYAVVVTDK